MKYTKEYLEGKVNESRSLKELMEKCGMNWYSSQNHIRNLIDKYELNTSHFIRSYKKWKKFSNEEIFIINSDTNRSTIRKRIIDQNLIPYVCQNCNCDDEWMGKTMPFILDHMNGIGDDNRIENLRFLCSNCDSIQDTYKSKNKNSNKQKVILFNKIQKDINRVEQKEKNKIIAREKQEHIKLLILNSGINFGKIGWGVKLSGLLKTTPQNALMKTKQLLPTFYEENCWKKFKDLEKFKRQDLISLENKHNKQIILLQQIINIKNSGINFKKRGCFAEANKILKFQQISDAIKWIKRNIPEVLNV